jgi:hypothetical protein
VDAPAVGYSVILPPSWAKIPLRNDAEGAIKRILDKSFPGVSRDEVAAARQELRQRLKKLINQARSNGGLDLYLPVELMRGLPVPASFVVSEGELGGPEELEPELIIAKLAAQGADVTEIDGAPAVRREELVPPDPGQEFSYGSRQVTYTLAVPGNPGRWLLVAFSTIGAGDPDDDIARLLASLFESVMTTFRWRRSPDATSSSGCS